MPKLHGQEIKVGDDVWTVIDGWLKVVSIDNDYDDGYTITVGDNKERYTEAGLLYISDKIPSIFWQEFDIPKKALIKLKVKVEKYVVLYEASYFDKSTQQQHKFYSTTQFWMNPHFTGKDEFDKDNKCREIIFVSIIPESMKEFYE